MALAARVLLTWFAVSVVSGPVIAMLLAEHCHPVARVSVAPRGRAVQP
jgi:hypothetical protein